MGVMCRPIRNFLPFGGCDAGLENLAESSIKFISADGIANVVVKALYLRPDGFFVFRSSIDQPFDKVGQFINVVSFWEMHPIIGDSQCVSAVRTVPTLCKPSR